MTEIDAAVAVVEGRAREALASTDKPFAADGYVTAWVVATRLRDQGVITHPDLDSKGVMERDRARKSIEAKAKRLLDTEAAKPNARVLRFTTRSGETTPPRLTGLRQGISGRGATIYTTPELYQEATRRVELTFAKAKAESDAMSALLGRWSNMDLPTPIKNTSRDVTFTVAQFASLVETLEDLHIWPAGRPS